MKVLRHLREWAWNTNASAILAKRPKEYAGGNTAYKRFIILAHQRSGSSMVVATLNKNPAILAFGELFVKTRIGHYVKGFESHSPALLHLRAQDPVRFLEEHAFRATNANIQAVGFKLFPDHLDSPATRPVWEWLLKNTDIKIIFLTRENLLDVYRSLVLANRTGVFGIRDASDRQDVTLEIDPKEAEKEFRKRQEYQSSARAKLSNHDVLDITYEELINDLNGNMMRIQEFIGVEVRPLEVSTVRQEVRPLSEVITNIDDLRSAWKGTEWESFLVED